MHAIILHSDATKNFGNGSFIKSITYETSYTITNDYSNHMSPSNCIRTTVSKMYDVVIFIELEKEIGSLVTVHNTYIPVFESIIRGTHAGYVFMNKMPTSWTTLIDNINGGGFVGPYIEYDKCPTYGVKVRRNGLSIERYCAKYTSNIDYQLLARKGITYYVYGLMLEDHISNLFK